MRIRPRLLAGLGLIALTFSLGLAGAAYRSGRLKTSWENHIIEVPRLEAPEEVDLGEAEFGQMVEAKFVLANRGKSPLVLSNFRSSCACDGLEVQDGGRYVRPTTLTIEPGGVANMRLAQRVRVDVGEVMRSVVSFQTNDPALPEARVEIRIPIVSGGVSCSPAIIAAGTLPIGAAFESLVDVFDRGNEGRRVESVTSTLPDLIQARFQPAAECPHPPTGSNAARFLGRLVVTFRTDRPASVNGTVRVCLAGRLDRPDVIEVRGRIAGLIEAAPTGVVLPRQSDAGVIYNSACVCRSPFGKPFKLDVRHCPPELAVTIDGDDSVAVHSVSISVLAPERLSMPAGETTSRITFVARFTEQTFEFSIPVTVLSR